MELSKRYCVEYVDGTIECFRDGFWYSTTGVIIKWCIFGGIFLFFMLWFVGGYLHAKSRLKKGKPLLGYHRFLVSYSERKRYGQVPQNHFTFYATQQPYGAPPQAYGPRPDGTWPEPPPMYTPPAGATKMDPNQHGGAPMEMPMYGAAPQRAGGYPTGGQQTGVVGANADPESQHQLPPRPQQAKLAIGKLVGRWRR